MHVQTDNSTMWYLSYAYYIIIYTYVLYINNKCMLLLYTCMYYGGIIACMERECRICTCYMYACTLK